MNILQLSKNMNVGGVSSHIIELSRQLQLMGHTVIVASTGGTQVEELKKDNIKHITVDFLSKNLYVQFKNINKLVNIIKDDDINIIHTHWRITSVSAKIISKITGVDFVWTNHLNNIPSSFFYRTFTFYGKKVITVSNDMVPFLQSKLNIRKEKIKVVANAVDKSKYILPSFDLKRNYQEKYGVNPTEKVITLLGRLAPVKGHLFLIEALHEITLKHPKLNYKLILTGEGNDEYKNKINELLEKYGLLEKAVFTGFTDPVEILSISDLMVLPSENEGFGIVCIEAFAMKVPVIRTTTAGYSDMKEYCIGVNYGDVRGLSNEITNIFTDVEYKNLLVEKAFNFFNEEFTSDKMAQKILKIYNE